MKVKLSNSAVFNLALDLVPTIIHDAQVGVEDTDNGVVVKAYPIPRGGVAASYAVCWAMPSGYGHELDIVDNPDEADIFIDDIIDSGATLRRYAVTHPGIQFHALVDKRKLPKSPWYVFPWEVGEDDSIKSAIDIPLRLLQYIGEDTERSGLKETPQRFLAAWNHYTSGYDKDPSKILKEFEDGAENYNEMVLVKNIPVFSHCEHHLAPFYGVAHVAYIPNGKIVGLSKIPRIVDLFMRRLQVQERLTRQIADALFDNLQPKGVAVVIDCAHSCMISRGVEVQGSTTVTSALLGVFKDSAEVRAEFMGLIK